MKSNFKKSCKTAPMQYAIQNLIKIKHPVRGNLSAALDT